MFFSFQIYLSRSCAKSNISYLKFMVMYTGWYVMRMYEYVSFMLFVGFWKKEEKIVYINCNYIEAEKPGLYKSTSIMDIKKVCVFYPGLIALEKWLSANSWECRQDWQYFWVFTLKEKSGRIHQFRLGSKAMQMHCSQLNSQ